MTGRSGGYGTVLEALPPDAAVFEEPGFDKPAAPGADPDAAAAIGGAALGPLDSPPGGVGQEPAGENPPCRQRYDFDNNDALPRASTAARGKRDRRREVDPVAEYLKRIGKIPLLNAEQEVSLAKQIEAGLYAKHKLEQGGVTDTDLERDLAQIVREGKEAKDQFISANLRLVVSIAKHYIGRGMDLLEVIQEGNLGLIHATEKFDHAQGYKFSTYATWWIRQYISRAVSTRSGAVTLPTHMAEDIQRMRRAQDELMRNNGREPTMRELADHLSLPLARVEDLLIYSQPPVSLDAPLSGSDTDKPLISSLDTPGAPASEAVEQASLLKDVKDVMRSMLSERDYSIMVLRFGLEDGKQHTLKEVARKCGLTTEGVRQCIKRNQAALAEDPRIRQLLQRRP